MTGRRVLCLSSLGYCGLWAAAMGVLDLLNAREGVLWLALMPWLPASFFILYWPMPVLFAVLLAAQTAIFGVVMSRLWSRWGARADRLRSVYCKECGYDLRLLPESRCPECGTAFAPANPRTFCSQPPRLRLRRWSKRLARVILIAVVVGGVSWGWTYWGWTSEQHTLARLDPSRKADASARGLLGWDVSDRLGRVGFVLDRVRWLNVGDLPVGDTELAQICQLTWLEDLTLAATEVTDAGIVRLENLGRLSVLDLSKTRVTDGGTGPLRRLKAIKALSLGQTRITDATLVSLKELKHLRGLCLSHTAVTDGGVGHLKALPDLACLDLSATQVTDAALPVLATLPKLEELCLSGTAVSDQGLERLAAGRQLSGLWRGLWLDGTKVTAEGVRRLTKALPEVPIVWDGTLVLPQSRTDPAHDVANRDAGIWRYRWAYGTPSQQRQALEWFARALPLGATQAYVEAQLGVGWGGMHDSFGYTQPAEHVDLAIEYSQRSGRTLQFIGLYVNGREIVRRESE